MTWSDDLLTGDREIDESHRALFGRALVLARACERRQGAMELDATLAFLADYGAQHFASEEAKMAAMQYPYLATHIAAHRAFRNRVEELQQNAAGVADKESAARVCAEFAIEWFNRHIKLVDRPFIEYLRGERQLKGTAGY